MCARVGGDGARGEILAAQRIPGFEQPMDSVVKIMMNCALQMMNSAVEMRNSVLKMMNFSLTITRLSSS